MPFHFRSSECRSGTLSGGVVIVPIVLRYLLAVLQVVSMGMSCVVAGSAMLFVTPEEVNLQLKNQEL